MWQSSQSHEAAHPFYPHSMCRADLELAGSSPGRQSWLQPAFNSSSGTLQLYGWMERYFERPEFLKRVTNARAQAAAQRGQQELTVQPAEPHLHPEPQVADPGWWTVDQITDSTEQVSAAAHFVKTAGCLPPLQIGLQMTTWLAAQHLGNCVCWAGLMAQHCTSIPHVFSRELARPPVGMRNMPLMSHNLSCCHGLMHRAAQQPAHRWASGALSHL